MTLEDLYLIGDTASKHYKEFPAELKLNGASRSLQNKEIVTLSYYKSVVQYISSKGIDISSLPEIIFIESGSGVESEDYNG